MGRFGDASWWWEYGLDGLIGGIAGGIVAWGAVWLTLRGTRRQGDEQTAELAVARLQAAGIRSGLLLDVLRDFRTAASTEQVMAEVSELATAIAEARVRTMHRWPLMADRPEDLTADMRERPPGAVGGDQMSGVAKLCTALATEFLEDPDAYAASPWWRRPRTASVKAEAADSPSDG